MQTGTIISLGGSSAPVGIPEPGSRNAQVSGPITVGGSKPEFADLVHIEPDGRQWGDAGVPAHTANSTQSTPPLLAEGPPIDLEIGHISGGQSASNLSPAHADASAGKFAFPSTPDSVESEAAEQSKKSDPVPVPDQVQRGETRPVTAELGARTATPTGPHNFIDSEIGPAATMPSTGTLSKTETDAIEVPRMPVAQEAKPLGSAAPVTPQQREASTNAGPSIVPALTQASGVEPEREAGLSIAAGSPLGGRVIGPGPISSTNIPALDAEAILFGRPVKAIEATFFPTDQGATKFSTENFASALFVPVAKTPLVPGSSQKQIAGTSDPARDITTAALPETHTAPLATKTHARSEIHDTIRLLATPATDTRNDVPKHSDATPAETGAQRTERGTGIAIGVPFPAVADPGAGPMPGRDSPGFERVMDGGIIPTPEVPAKTINATNGGPQIAAPEPVAATSFVASIGSGGTLALPLETVVPDEFTIAPPAETQTSVSTRTASPADLPVARHVVHQIAQAAAQLGDGPVEVTLDPEELGRVRLTLASTDGTMNVLVSVERLETAELLRRHIETLGQEFREMGYREIDFQFSHQRGDGNPDPGGDAGRSGATKDPEVEVPAPVPLTRLALGNGIDIRI